MGSEDLAKAAKLRGVIEIMGEASRYTSEVLDYIMDKIRAGECSVKEANAVYRSLMAAQQAGPRAKEALNITTRGGEKVKGLTLNVEKLQVLNLSSLSPEEQEKALLSSLEGD